MKLLKKWLMWYRIHKALKSESKSFDNKVQKLLPAPDKKKEFNDAANRLEELNKDSNSTIAQIEAQMDLLTDLVFKNTQKKVLLFNPSLTERKNDRLDDPALDTREGTKKVLQELTTYELGYKENFKRHHVNYNSSEANPLYWEI